jgi:hypothetical protein
MCGCSAGVRDPHLIFQRHPVRFALGIAAIFLGAALGRGTDPTLLFRGRSFFGVYRVLRYPKAQGVAERNDDATAARASIRSSRPSRSPITIATGRLGQSFAWLMRGNPNRRVAIVGLGTGTVACYGRPNETWTFYEIDPLIERIAFNPKYFLVPSRLPLPRSAS